MDNIIAEMAFRRSVKNVVKNFSDIEVKVREATSNDPWGPSSSLMSDIADATYNVAAFSSIMSMLWKRLNDHGKNWRHVYKSLVVLEYIIKTGSERVAQQCRENIFAIQTLKDFQFIDKDGKDQGMNVREKSKQLVALLKDDERLKNERQRALKAKERFSQSQGGLGNTNFSKNRKFTSSYPRASSDLETRSHDDSSIPSSKSWEARDPQKDFDSRSTDGRITSDIEKIRPSNEAEEEMQLQIALAMSKEQAEQEKQLSEGDEERLKMALQESKTSSPPKSLQVPNQSNSTLLDLSEPAITIGSSSTNSTAADIFDPWTGKASGNAAAQGYQPQNVQTDPWAPAPVGVSNSNGMFMPSAQPASQASLWPGPQSQQQVVIPQQPVVPPTSVMADPWSSHPPQQSLDPWAPVASQTAPINDPFAPQSTSSSFGMTNGFDPRGTLSAAPAPSASPHNPFDMSSVNSSLPEPVPMNNGTSQNFLGNTSRLVDLDNILSDKNASGEVRNPFATTMAPKTTNPFMQDKPKAKSINELRTEQTTFTSVSADSGVLLPTPLIPDSTNRGAQSTNPFF